MTSASSFHLWWEPSPPPSLEVAVSVRIEAEPEHSHLVFWALQVTFVADSGRRLGGAHVGLQWSPRHPRNRAVNWGGYDERGSILSGTESTLPSTPSDPNTRDFAWEPGRSYRLGVRRGSQGWAGTLDDGSGVTVIRELLVPGTALVSPVVWTECFAPCDAPSVSAVWTNPVAIGASGAIVPRGYRVRYQEIDGCPNTDSAVTVEGVRQTTGVARRTADGALIPVKDGQGGSSVGR